MTFTAENQGIVKKRFLALSTQSDRYSDIQKEIKEILSGSYFDSNSGETIVVSDETLQECIRDFIADSIEYKPMRDYRSRDASHLTIDIIQAGKAELLSHIRPEQLVALVQIQANPREGAIEPMFDLIAKIVEAYPPLLGTFEKCIQRHTSVHNLKYIRKVPGYINVINASDFAKEVQNDDGTVGTGRMLSWAIGARGDERLSKFIKPEWVAYAASEFFHSDEEGFKEIYEAIIDIPELEQVFLPDTQFVYEKTSKNIWAFNKAGEISIVVSEGKTPSGKISLTREWKGPGQIDRDKMQKLVPTLIKLARDGEEEIPDVSLLRVTDRSKLRQGARNYLSQAGYPIYGAEIR